MPYAKRKYKRRYKKKGYHPYIKATAPAVGYIAAKVATKIVKKYVNTEMKYYDLEKGLSNMTDSGNNTQSWGLNLIATSGSEGPGQDREGRQIKCMTVNVKGTMRGNTSDTEDRRGTVELWYENDGTGTLPSWVGSLYDNTETNGTAIGATMRINEMRGMNLTHNFRKLASKKVVFAQNGRMVHPFEFYVKLGRNGGGIITKWKEDDFGGTIANLEKGLLFMVYISDKSTDAYPTINWVSRVRYIDN